MHFRMLLFAFLLVAGSLALPVAAHAGVPFFGPIIPPDISLIGNSQTCPLGWGGFLVIVNNIISFLITLAIVFVAPLMIAYSGFLFVVNPVNPAGKEQAKKILMNTIVGIIVALAGYMIVAALMAVLYNANARVPGTTLGTWSDIIGSRDLDPCLRVAGSQPAVTPPPSIIAVVPGCPTCISLADKGLTCKTASSCTLVPAVADRLVILKNNFSGTWTVTEAFPPTPTVIHSNPCHANGTCIDAGFRIETAYTVANIVEFATDAHSAGLRAVFETVSCQLRDQARAQGVTAYCKTDQGYNLITGDHFSVYAK